MDIRNQGELGGLVANYARLQARVWADPNFTQSLTSDPRGVLRDYGIQFKDTQRVDVVINTPGQAFLIIPQKPDYLTVQNIEQVAAAGTFGTAGSVGSAGTICGCAATFGTLGTFGCAEL